MNLRGDKLVLWILVANLTFVLGAWAFGMSDRVVIALQTLGNLAAATFAALSAQAARESAGAATATIRELKAQRLSERAPLLAVELERSEFGLRWNPREEWSVIPEYVDELNDMVKGYPTIAVHNYGGGPAFDLSMEFEVVADDGELSIPEYLSKNANPSDFLARDDFTLRFISGGKADTYGLFRTTKRHVLHCGPHEKRQVTIPPEIICAMMLVAFHRHDAGKLLPMVDLRITCSGRGVDGEFDPIARLFRFSTHLGCSRTSERLIRKDDLAFASFAAGWAVP